MNNNHIIISYLPGTQAAADATIRGYLISGYAGGAWNGPGLDSSAANALFVSGNKHYGLGYADGADMNGSSPLVVGLGAGNIEVKYTLYGDANLDGVVNGTDFGILAAHFGDQVTAWDEGDFNYDGVVNGTDFGALAANFGQQANGTAVELPAADYAALDAFAAANGLTGRCSGTRVSGVIAGRRAWRARPPTQVGQLICRLDSRTMRATGSSSCRPLPRIWPSDRPTTTSAARRPISYAG